MFTDAQLQEIVKNQIEKDEKLGDQAGGSGHLGFVSYRIKKISDPEESQVEKGRTWKISYEYVTIVETEFTYYPDNPPYESLHEKTIILDDSGTIIE